MANLGRSVLAVVLSGLMLVLTMPLGERAYLAWFALVPVLVVSRGRGFTFGFLAGVGVTFLAAWLSTMGWLYRHPDPHGEIAWVYTGFGTYGVAMSLAIGVWSDRGTARMPSWWFAAVATLLEIILFVQMPAHIALSQYRQPAVVQVAAFGGVWMVSFLIWYANLWLASLDWKKAIAGSAVLAGLSICLGLVRFSPAGPYERFAAAQIEEPTDKSFQAFQIQASKSDPAFVVWPEFGGLMLAPNGNTATLRRVSSQPGIAPFIITFRDQIKPLPHNISVLFTKGQESAPYAKRKLFGSETQMHTPGTGPVAVPYRSGAVGLEICFDSTFPQIIRESARLANVNVIALPSIDPPSTNHFIAAMHAAYSPFRCAEEGVALVKADGVAYSQIVDPMGQIVAEAAPGDRVIEARVSIQARDTLYKRFGDWFLWLCGLLVVGGIWRARWRVPDNKADAPVPPGLVGP